MAYTVPPIAFAGVSERAMMLPTGIQNIWKHNFLGLRSVINSYFFPIPLSDYHFVFGLYDPQNADFSSYKICIIAPDKTVLLTATMGIKKDLSEKDISEWDTSDGGFHKQAMIGPFGNPPNEPVWIFFPMQFPGGMISQPGEYKIKLTINSEDYSLGSLFFMYILAPPLTPDRIAALRSDPDMEGQIGLAIGCPKCESEIFTYAGLDRLPEREKQGEIWYKDLPEEFKCKCGEVNIKLNYYKENLHALLGKVRPLNEPISTARLHEQSERLYTQGAIENICTQFTNLLNKKPLEEEVQKFIKANPTLLQQFSAKRIFYKSPILTKYVTDIVVLNQKNELLLIELEKPDISLLKKDGRISAELQHAFDQVRDWIQAVNERREAVLDGIGGLKINDVSGIKGIVICGRNKDYESEHIRRLRAIDHGDIEFFSYDDLTASLSSMANRLATL